MDYIYYAIAWIIYYAIHSVLAAEQTKKILQQAFIPSRWYRLFYNAVAILLFVNLASWHGELSQKVAYQTGWVSMAVGIIILLIGSYIMLLALRQYNLSEFAGTAYLKGEVAIGNLNTSGLNAHLRHPIYLATFLLVWGLWIVFPSWSLFVPVVITTLYIPIGVYFEEQKLVKIFGSAYLEYRSNVPMIFPKIR